jgi:hypothetical protein
MMGASAWNVMDFNNEKVEDIDIEEKSPSKGGSPEFTSPQSSAKRGS